jgi:hypothetical protein
MGNYPYNDVPLLHSQGFAQLSKTSLYLEFFDATA